MTVQDVETRSEWEPEDLRKLNLPEDVHISPDGSCIAYTISRIAPQKDEYLSHVVVEYIAGDMKGKQLSLGEGSAPTWSPDGSKVAFLRTANIPWRKRTVGGISESFQLHVADIRGLQREQWTKRTGNTPAIRQITTHSDDVGSPTWSPDGKTIAVTYTAVNLDDDAVDRLYERRAMEIPRIRTIQEVYHKADDFGSDRDPSHYGYTYEFSAHIALVDATTGEFHTLTSGLGFDDCFASWSPDGKKLAFVSSRNTPQGLRGDIWIVNRDGTDLHKLLNDDSISIGGTPVWSPEGNRLAFYGSRYPTSYGHEDLYIMDDEGKHVSNLTQGEAFTAGDQGLDDVRDEGSEMLWWTPDGWNVVFAASENGSVKLKRAELNVARDRVKRIVDVTDPGQRVYSASVSKRGKLVYCASSFAEPGEIWQQSASGTTHQLTHLNTVLVSKRVTRMPESLPVVSKDGLPIQTWILHGAGEGKRPAIVQIHGGPACMYGSSFFMEFQLLAAAGYSVVFGNPRGSTGYGAPFARKVFGDSGGGDYQDVMAETDAAVATGKVDPQRLGVCGGSYGGFMTNWIIGHTKRFKAAITMRSISNQMSFWGTSDIGPLFGEVVGIPTSNVKEFLRRSPITYVQKITTPLLILHGEKDLRCPLEQAQQLFTALKIQGKDVEFRIFEGASHELSRSGSPRQRIERLKIITNWWDVRIGRSSPSPAVSHSKKMNHAGPDAGRSIA